MINHIRLLRTYCIINFKTMTHKTRLALILTFVFAASIIMVGCFNKDNQTQSETIKIGAIIPLTGKGAHYGEIYKTSLLAMEEYMNSKSLLGEKKIRVILEDNQMDPQKTLTIATQLNQIQGVKIFFVPFSGPSFALEDMARAQKIILLANGYDEEFSKKHVYIFNGAHAEMPKMVELFTQQVLNTNPSCSRATYLSFKIPVQERSYAAFESTYNKTNMGANFVEIGESDYKTLITKMKEQQIDCLPLALYDFMTLNLIKQLVEMDYQNLNIYLMAGKGNIDLKNFKEAIDYKKLEENNIDIQGIGFAFNGFTDSKEAENWRVDLIAQNPALLDNEFTQQVYDSLMMLVNGLKTCEDKNNLECLSNKTINTTFAGSTNKNTRVDSFGNVVDRKFVLFGFDEEMNFEATGLIN